MYTVTALARRCGLSRSTLLYYDRIGLLRPQGRSASGYRLYSAADLARLERVCLYRDAGVPLEKIATLLDVPDHAAKGALAHHLQSLALEIQSLREQQARVVRLLLLDALPAGRGHLRKDQLVAVLRQAGLEDADLKRLHVLFEQTNPDDHQQFLEQLGIDADEVRRIRAASRDA